MNKIKVLVTGCSEPHWWYEDLIGQEIKVKSGINLFYFGPGYYRLDGPSGHFILEKDCEPIQENFNMLKTHQS